MSQHDRYAGREIRKKGLSIELKPVYGDDLDKVQDLRARSLESALKTLKRRMVQEGIVRDMRRKEYFESKGQIRRRKMQEAVLKQKKQQKLNDQW
jgi:ribosomal protein S21